MTMKSTFTCAFMLCGLTTTASHAATIASGGEWRPAGGDQQRSTRRRDHAPGGSDICRKLRASGEDETRKGLNITIKSAANPSQLPAAGQRVLPTHANRLPNIKSPNAAPCAPDGGGRAILGAPVSGVPGEPTGGYGDIITLGSGDPAVQTSLEASSKRPRRRSLLHSRRCGHRDRSVGSR